MVSHNRHIKNVVIYIIFCSVTCMMWKNTISSGWEYLVTSRGLGFKSYICHLCVIFICVLFDNIIEHDEWYCNLRIIGIIMKHELVELVVQFLSHFMVVCLNLGLRKIIFFLLKSFLARMWRARNPSCLVEGWKIKLKWLLNTP